jgi:hypothetical protein
LNARLVRSSHRVRVLKHGDTFAVFDHRGDIGGEPGNHEGLYHRDTRMLSQLQLLLEEAPPLLLSSMTQDDNAVTVQTATDLVVVPRGCRSGSLLLIVIPLYRGARNRPEGPHHD